jgi:SAM-dependent methyltransferase
MQRMTPSYSFGDTATAEHRLDIVASVFEAPSRAFLAAVVTGPPRLACDLGCGPGNTTAMIGEVTGALRVVGLDASAAFVRSAQAREAQAREAQAREAQARGTGEFQVWEAGSPLPVTGPDLIYARLLLAHLPDAPGLAASWAGQLAPGGQLLLDEVERIDTSSPVFTEYLAMTVERVRTSGADMYAGPLLASLPLPGGCRVTHDAVVSHPVAAADAARMFLLNLSVWRDWGNDVYGSQAVSGIERSLAAIEAGDLGADITWQLRQVAVSC